TACDEAQSVGDVRRKHAPGQPRRGRFREEEQVAEEESCVTVVTSDRGCAMVAIDARHFFFRSSRSRRSNWRSARPLERFRAKWIPVRVKKTRQNKKLELRFRFHQNGKSSSPRVS